MALVISKHIEIKANVSIRKFLYEAKNSGRTNPQSYDQQNRFQSKLSHENEGNRGKIISTAPKGQVRKYQIKSKLLHQIL